MAGNQEGEMIQSVIFTCSLQPQPSSFQSMLMSAHLQSGTVSCDSQQPLRSFLLFRDGHFRLLGLRQLLSETSIWMIMPIFYHYSISKFNGS